MLDLIMPEIVGFAFLAALRRHEGWRAIPVLVVTAKDLTDEDRQRLNGKMERVLQKDLYGREGLLAEIRDLLGPYVGHPPAGAEG